MHNFVSEFAARQVIQHVGQAYSKRVDHGLEAEVYLAGSDDLGDVLERGGVSTR